MAKLVIYLTIIVIAFVHAQEDAPKTYQEASRTCQARNSWLVRIKSEEVNNAVRRIISNGQYDRYWIGAYEQDGIEDKWIWNDGSSLSYENWSGNEPNEHFSGEDCVTMIKQSGEWNDLRCSESIGYVCQSDLNPTTYVGGTEFTINAYTEDYADASSYCQDRQSKLVEIKTAEIQTALSDEIDKNQFNFDIWTSGNDIEDEDSWKWGDGTDIPQRGSVDGYQNWRSGQPGGAGGGRDCLLLRHSHSWQWEDRDCDDRLSFICQRDLLVLSPTQQSATAVSGKNVSISLNITSHDGLVTVRVFREPSTTPFREIPSVGNGTITFTERVVANSAGTYRVDASSDFTKYNVSAFANLTVHEPASIIYISPTTIRAPVTTGPDYVECIAFGFPTPTVQWIKDGVRVSESTTNNVYQVIQTATVVLLNIGNAETADAGTYTCRANNTVGKDSPTMIEVIRTISLIVYNPPTIQSVMRESCSAIGRITVTWIPGEATYGVNHRFTIIPINGSNLVSVFRNVTSSANGGNQTTHFIGLQPTTRYRIEIRVCPDLCIALSNFSVESAITTGIGLPGEVRNPLLQQYIVNGSEENCYIDWFFPATPSPEQITGYQINLTSTLVHRPSGMSSYASSNDIFLLEVNQRRFLIPTSPNRNYTAQIQAQTCAGYGPSLQASGYCVTKRGAPTLIPVPTITEEGQGTQQRKFTVFLADESNGTISCVFVILTQTESGNAGSKQTFTEEDLRNAATASQTEPTPDKAYITQALSRSKFNSTSMETTLGDDTQSSCNVSNHNSNRVKRQISSEGIYEGRNYPLRTGAEYRIIIVAATPIDDGIVLFTASEEMSFSNAPVRANNAGLIAGLCIGFILLIGIIIFTLFYFKRRNDMKGERLSNENTSTPIPIRSPETESTYNHLNDQQQKSDPTYDRAMEIELNEIRNISSETAYDNLRDNNQSLSPENDYDKTSYRSRAGTATVPVLIPSGNEQTYEMALPALNRIPEPDSNAHTYETAVIGRETGETTNESTYNHLGDTQLSSTDDDTYSEAFASKPSDAVNKDRIAQECVYEAAEDNTEPADTYNHLNTANQGRESTYDKTYPVGNSTSGQNDEDLYEETMRDELTSSEDTAIYQNPDSDSQFQENSTGGSKPPYARVKKSK